VLFKGFEKFKKPFSLKNDAGLKGRENQFKVDVKGELMGECDYCKKKGFKKKGA